MPEVQRLRADLEAALKEGKDRRGRPLGEENIIARQRMAAETAEMWDRLGERRMATLARTRAEEWAEILAAVRAASDPTPKEDSGGGVCGV
jgi:hypothetical protein